MKRERGPGAPSRTVPDVPLSRVAAPEHVGHAAGGFGRLGRGLGVAHVHAHHRGGGKGATHVLLRLGEHDVHLDTPVQGVGTLEHFEEQNDLKTFGF